MRNLICRLLVGWALCSSAFAQGGALTYHAFFLTARAPDLVAGVVAARVALGVNVPVARVCNTGAVTAYVELGTILVTATVANSYALLAGQCASLDASVATHLSAITASSTATLVTMLGSGTP